MGQSLGKSFLDARLTEYIKSDGVGTRHGFTVIVSEFPAFFKAFEQKCTHTIDDIGMPKLEKCRGGGVGVHVHV